MSTEFKQLFIYGYRLLWWIFNAWRYKYLGKLSYIHRPLKITRKLIFCGSKVNIAKNCRIEGIKTHNNIVFDPQIIFSDNVSIEQNLHLTCANKIFIGQHTAIAANVTITDIHHSYEDIDLPIELQNIIVSDIYIGPDSKIYNNVVILPGVHIGKHVTIGANSVVRGNIPDYSVAVGSPAKLIKKFNFETNQWEKC